MTIANSNTSVVEITPSRGWGRLGLRELWDYRELIGFFFWRDVKGRYRQMALGPLWMVINPLLNMVLFTVIFGMVAKLPSDGVPYPLFNYTALLPWTFFSGCVNGAAGSLQSYKNLISKVYFPRLSIPLVGVLAALFDFLISFVILIGMMLAYGYVPSWHVVFLPIYLLIAAGAGLAMGLWFAAWIVHFYDVSTLLGYGLKLLMYVSPVVYASSFVPAQWQTLYSFNPMAGVIDGFRWALLGVGEPHHGALALSALLVIPFLLGGAYYFRRMEKNIVDIA